MNNNQKDTASDAEASVSVASEPAAMEPASSLASPTAPASAPASAPDAPMPSPESATVVLQISRSEALGVKTIMAVRDKSREGYNTMIAWAERDKERMEKSLGDTPEYLRASMLFLMDIGNEVQRRFDYYKQGILEYDEIIAQLKSVEDKVKGAVVDNGIAITRCLSEQEQLQAMLIQSIEFEQGTRMNVDTCINSLFLRYQYMYPTLLDATERTCVPVSKH